MREPGQTGGPEAALPSDQLIAAVGRATNNDRLEDAVKSDRGSELSGLGIVKPDAGLVRVARDPFYGDLWHVR